MIQYDKDGATLYYIDANGIKISAGVFDGVKWSALDAIMLQQIAAITENNDAVTKYNLSLSNAQISVNAGRGSTVEAPPKPLQHVVSDTGVSTYVPFVPALADLVPLVTTTTTNSIKVETVDTQAIMYAMITAIYRKMFPSA
jgi:hypothetical protein